MDGAKRVMTAQEFITVYRDEPVRYTTVESAEVFPTQPYSKIVRGYPMVHPEQVNTTMVGRVVRVGGGDA